MSKQIGELSMVHSFSSELRGEYIQQLEGDAFDLLVIGGGVAGAGIALDAVVRGMKTVLIERADFASGSSGAWSTLFHNESRQAHQLDMKWHGEYVKERLILHENAPHLMKQLPLLLPAFKVSMFGRHSFGSKVVERISDLARKEKRKHLSKKELNRLAPLLSDKSIKGAVLYHEFWRDDARLVFDLLKEATRRGAMALNYMKAETFLYENGKAVGVVAIDQLTGEAYKVFAKKIINATGIEADTLREQDRSMSTKTIGYMTDAYMVIPKELLAIDQVVYLELDDKKLISLAPRGKKVVLSLTNSDERDKNEREVMLAKINQTFQQAQITPDDIEASWHVKRPIVIETNKKKHEAIRKNDWFESASGLVTVVCGHTTGYRLLAKQILDRIAKKAGPFSPCETDTVTLSGGYAGSVDQFDNYKEKRLAEGVQYGISREKAQELVDMYGSNVGAIYARFWSYKKQARLFGLPPVIFAQLLFSIEEEMAVTPADFLVRRTAMFYFNKTEALHVQEAVFRYMRDRFNWSEEQEAQYRLELDALIKPASR
ncbi:glycerol-3-phosphate dehydrogenase/oxidase [Shouchella clausii]|uniref:glycerol-3-phosphate dehydrogenase/oxidase n=1 Tax=Shouchella clausii TaxID=79880 RepID=UPI0015955BDC|nr:FAD-dependent oxidoreductase [Shouchella clausii]